LSASREIVNTRLSIPALERTFDLPNGIVYHVDAPPTGDVHDVFLPAIFRVVNDDVRAACPASNLELAWGRSSDDTCAER
jgi:hypothetical protein